MSGPVQSASAHSLTLMCLRRDSLLHSLRSLRRLVGVPGIEPGTSSLSGMRSNRLSYTPFDAGLRPCSGQARSGFHLTSLPACQAVVDERTVKSASAHSLPLMRLRRDSLLHSLRSLRRLVEAAGFEPATSSLQSWRSTN